MFHDLELKFGNIDHVVVGPPGVFAIETKYRRKLSKEKEGYIVDYDGRMLHFGRKKTVKPLEQARRQAQELEKLISKLFAVKRVVPVVVFPGWFVKGDNKGDVWVKNHKQLLGWLANERPVLDQATVEQVSAFLDERNRDVEM